MEYYERLQLVAGMKKIYQTDLVEGLKKDRSTVNRWWNGEIIPGAKNNDLIANFLGCNSNWLATGHGDHGVELTVNKQGEALQQNQTAEPTPIASETEQMKEFKKLCLANLDHVLEYIAEAYGKDSIGIQNFLDDLQKVHHPYRVWLHEKKQERKNSQVEPGKFIAGNGI